jgi:hypothetical protein
MSLTIKTPYVFPLFFSTSLMAATAFGFSLLGWEGTVNRKEKR